MSIIGKEHDDGDNQTEPAFSLNHLALPLLSLSILEPFFIVEVFNKGVAQEGMSDVNGHYILSGEQYAEVGYLQKKDEKKSCTISVPEKAAEYLHSCC